MDNRDNLKEAGQSDGKLTALVDDNAAQFAALGLGTLPGRSGEAKQVCPAPLCQAACVESDDL